MDYDDFLRKRGRLVTTGLTKEALLTKMHRASGECACNECGRCYYDHPYVDELRDWEDNPYLHILCNGEIVKL